MKVWSLSSSGEYSMRFRSWNMPFVFFSEKKNKNYRLSRLNFTPSHLHVCTEKKPKSLLYDWNFLTLRKYIGCYLISSLHSNFRHPVDIQMICKYKCKWQLWVTGSSCVLYSPDIKLKSHQISSLIKIILLFVFLTKFYTVQNAQKQKKNLHYHNYN